MPLYGGATSQKAPRACTSKQLDTLLDMILEWSGVGEALLWRVAAQVLGLLVEQQSTGAERYMQRVLAVLVSAVSHSLVHRGRRRVGKVHFFGVNFICFIVPTTS